MGAIEYDLENLDVRPSRLKRWTYFLVWFATVVGIPFVSTFLGTRYYEGRDDIESLACAVTMTVCISPYLLWLLWRGTVYIGAVTNRNLHLGKLALFAISFGGRQWSQEEWEEDTDYYFFFDANGPNGPNLYDDHHDHHH